MSRRRHERPIDASLCIEHTADAKQFTLCIKEARSKRVLEFHGPFDVGAGCTLTVTGFLYHEKRRPNNE